jgi:dihydrofolate synthase/folylpolyglutamate synthase
MDLEGTAFSFDGYDDLQLGLLGTYQPRNAAVVLTAVDIFRREGWAISDEAIRDGLAEVTWPGRFEILSKEPLVIFDGAHNAQGIAAAVAGIRHYFGDQKVYVLTGVLQDKDYVAIADDLATVASRAFVLTPENPRALPGETYARLLTRRGVPAAAYPSVVEAYEAAVAAAAADGMALCCLGSLYTYASLPT